MLTSSSDSQCCAMCCCDVHEVFFFSEDAWKKQLGQSFVMQGGLKQTKKYYILKITLWISYHILSKLRTNPTVQWNKEILLQCIFFAIYGTQKINEIAWRPSNLRDFITKDKSSIFMWKHAKCRSKMIRKVNLFSYWFCIDNINNFQHNFVFHLDESKR